MKIRPTTGTRRTHSVVLKAGDDEIAILETAARLSDMNISFFVINAALRRACEVCSVTKKHEHLISKVEPIIISEDK